jgi:uncharacterized protein YutE (UPF0331/DUF86 family)
MQDDYSLEGWMFIIDRSSQQLKDANILLEETIERLYWAACDVTEGVLMLCGEKPCRPKNLPTLMQKHGFNKNLISVLRRTIDIRDTMKHNRKSLSGIDILRIMTEINAYHNLVLEQVKFLHLKSLTNLRSESYRYRNG